MPTRSASAPAAGDVPGSPDAGDAAGSPDAGDAAGSPDAGDVAVPPDAGEQPGHRERLIAAMATAIEVNEYRETTVADVVRLARTSRRSFYEQFEDRDACFLALFDATNNEIGRAHV